MKQMLLAIVDGASREEIIDQFGSPLIYSAMVKGYLIDTGTKFEVTEKGVMYINSK